MSDEPTQNQSRPPQKPIWDLLGTPAHVCRVGDQSDLLNTVTVCVWCEGALQTMEGDGTLESKMKAGASGDDVKALHEHLQRFGFKLDLSDSKSGSPVDSADVKSGKWGDFTTRSVKMFALHAQVAQEPAAVIPADGKKLTAAIAQKIREWCRTSTVSPENYWEYPALNLTGKEMDAFGADHDKHPPKQVTLHHYIKQIQDDLAKIGFGVHDDTVCDLKKAHKPTGEYAVVADNRADKNLTDTRHLVLRFQRQAAWLWRMKTDGTHLSDVTAADPSHFGGAADGTMNAATAKVLHHWATHDLHMVIEKFQLKELHWPPDGGPAITVDSGSTPAKLRSDAYQAWYLAAKEIHRRGGTVEGPYSSSPRKWTNGKMTAAAHGNSAYSWHYAALGVDIGQHPAAGDGGIYGDFRYILERDGIKFRIWCWVEPQPAKPASEALDKVDPWTQYRNRNLKAKVDTAQKKVATEPTEPSPLFGVTSHKNAAGTDMIDVTAKEGWYVDVSAIMERYGMMRIPRHGNWVTKAAGWEWWHYQLQPGPPPGGAPLTFGDYLQLFGVHEHKLRNAHDGWTTHDDIDHAIG